MEARYDFIRCMLPYMHGAMVTTTTKSHWGRSLFGLCFQVAVHHWGNKGQYAKVGTEVKTRKERSLLICFLGLIQVPFLCNPGHLPRGGTTHSGMDPPIYTKSRGPTDIPAGKSNGHNSSIQVPSIQSPSGDSSLRQVDKNYQVLT